MLMEEVPERVQVVRLQSVLDAEPDFLGLVKALDNGLVAGGRVSALLLKDAVRRPGDPGEEQHRAGSQFVRGRDGDLQWAHVDATAGLDVEAGDPTEGGEVVIMFAHGVAREIQFNVAGGTRE